MCVSTGWHPNGAAHTSIPEKNFPLGFSCLSTAEVMVERVSAMKWCGLSATSVQCVFTSAFVDFTVCLTFACEIAKAIITHFCVRVVSSHLVYHLSSHAVAQFLLLRLSQTFVHKSH